MRLVAEDQQIFTEFLGSRDLMRGVRDLWEVRPDLRLLDELTSRPKPEAFANPTDPSKRKVGAPLAPEAVGYPDFMLRTHEAAAV